MIARAMLDPGRCASTIASLPFRSRGRVARFRFAPPRGDRRHAAFSARVGDDVARERQVAAERACPGGIVPASAREVVGRLEEVRSTSVDGGED